MLNDSVEYELELKRKRRRAYRKRYIKRPYVRAQRSTYQRLRRLQILEAKAQSVRPSSCTLCSKECKTHFDHDHITGRFRGWICKECNMALGLVKDSVTTLQKMISYVCQSKPTVLTVTTNRQ